MAEVIRVDFVRKARLVSNPIFDRFVDILRRQGLVEDDIADVLQAVSDHKFYEQCDDDIKRIVDIWFEHTAHL